MLKKCIRFFIYSGLLFLMILPITAQNQGAKNGIYAELFAGSGIAGASVNYDRIVYASDHMEIFAGAGFGTLIEASASSGSLNSVIPLSAGILYGGDHNIEFGLGRTFVAGSSFNSINAGYRYMPGDGGFLFKAGTDLILLDGDESLFGGFLSLGYAF